MSKRRLSKNNKKGNKQDKLSKYKDHYKKIGLLYKELYKKWKLFTPEQIFKNEKKILHELVMVLSKIISLSKRRSDKYIDELKIVNERLLRIDNEIIEFGLEIQNNNDKMISDLCNTYMLMSFYDEDNHRNQGVSPTTGTGTGAITGTAAPPGPPSPSPSAVSSASPSTGSSPAGTPRTSGTPAPDPEKNILSYLGQATKSTDEAKQLLETAVGEIKLGDDMNSKLFRNTSINAIKNLILEAEGKLKSAEKILKQVQKIITSYKDKQTFLNKYSEKLSRASMKLQETNNLVLDIKQRIAPPNWFGLYASEITKINQGVWKEAKLVTRINNTHIYFDSTEVDRSEYYLHGPPIDIHPITINNNVYNKLVKINELLIFIHKNGQDTYIPKGNESLINSNVSEKMDEITGSLGNLAQHIQPIKLPLMRDLTITEVEAVIDIISKNTNWKDEILNEPNINKGFFHIQGLVAQKLQKLSTSPNYIDILKQLGIVSNDDTEAEDKYNEIISQIDNSTS